MVQTRERRCPICGFAVPDGSEQGGAFPFCSERCKVIDLAAWLGGRYRVVDSESDAEGAEGRSDAWEL